MLSVYTPKELRSWFISSGYTMVDAGKEAERQEVRRTQEEELARLQAALQRLRYELELAVAQRCRGWTPHT